jgi:hypothetical protein
MVLRKKSSLNARKGMIPPASTRACLLGTVVVFGGSDIISECRNCCLIGSLVDGIKDVYGPIVALLDARSEFVLGKFVR